MDTFFIMSLMTNDLLLYWMQTHCVLLCCYQGKCHSGSWGHILQLRREIAGSSFLWACVCVFKRRIVDWLLVQRKQDSVVDCVLSVFWFVSEYCFMLRKQNSCNTHCKLKPKLWRYTADLSKKNTKVQKYRKNVNTMKYYYNLK